MKYIATKGFEYNFCTCTVHHGYQTFDAACTCYIHNHAVLHSAKGDDLPKANMLFTFQENFPLAQGMQ